MQQRNLAIAWTSLLFLVLLQRISASPAPRPAQVIEAERALITPSPVYNAATRTYKHRRDIISDLANAVDGVLSDLGNVPSYVASGIPNYFQGFPTGSDVLSSANVSSTDLDAQPTMVLNIP